MWLIPFFATQEFRSFFIAFISLDIAWKDLNIARMVQVNQLFNFFVYITTISNRVLMSKM